MAEAFLIHFLHSHMKEARSPVERCLSALSALLMARPALGATACCLLAVKMRCLFASLIVVVSTVALGRVTLVSLLFVYYTAS